MVEKNEKIRFKDVIGVILIILSFFLILFSIFGVLAEGFPSDVETWLIFVGVNLVYILLSIIGIFLLKKKEKETG